MELPHFDGHLILGETLEEGVEAAGGNIARVAKELGIYDSTLGNWVRQAHDHVIAPLMVAAVGPAP